MNVNRKAIVVCYSEETGTFHFETLHEYTQGNALRLLRDRTVAYHAIAVADTLEQADQAAANFRRLQRVARGLEEPAVRAP